MPIPREQNVLAQYPITSLTTAKSPRVVQAFVDYVVSPPGQATLRSFGFLPPA